jgi:23S rRNA (cytidine2498-2'-O)-methyltransferase
MMTTAWIATANRGFSVYAMEELRRLFPGAQFRHLQPAEVFLATLPAAYEQVVERLRAQEPVFLRHIHPVMAEAVIDGSAADLKAVREQATVLLERQFRKGTSPVTDARNGGESRDVVVNMGLATGKAPERVGKIAVQVRRQDGGTFTYALADVREAIADALVERFGVEPVVRGADWIVSAYIAAGFAYLGLSRPEHNLSDWTGGKIRFRREEEQVSRAKFKLLEAEHAFSLDLSAFRHALDIGAAPGGWTSLLLERGLNVTAVDPADLAPELKRHPRLTFLQTKAEMVKFRRDQFDLMVCDMNWSPRQMVKVVSGLAYALQEGGTAIVTLKLPGGKPFQALRETAADLQPALRLRKAKQLFHNRNELTLYMIREGS